MSSAADSGGGVPGPAAGGSAAHFCTSGILRTSSRKALGRQMGRERAPLTNEGESELPASSAVELSMRADTLQP